MPDSEITIRIEGIEEDGGDVRLSDFIDELNAIKKALKETERLVIPEENQAVSYCITNLSHSSPATVTIGIAARNPSYKDAPARISRRLTTSLSMVRRSHRFASHLDQRVLESFRELVSPTNKHVAQVVITGERNQKVAIDKVFRRGLDTLFQPQESERDEIYGRLERLDLHNKTQFDIFPRIGPSSIRCHGRASLYDDIIENVGKLVSVDGWAFYRKDSRFPSHIKVEKIYPQAPSVSIPSAARSKRDPREGGRAEAAEDQIRGMRDVAW